MLQKKFHQNRIIDEDIEILGEGTEGGRERDPNLRFF